MLRLQKHIADCGLASRRKAEEMILQNRVKVNGSAVSKLGTKIDPDKDRVEVDGKILKPRSQKIYIALNKPKGFECTCKKGEGRTILDLVKIPERIFPAGRLDLSSSGLLILTNDGEFANKLMHPRSEHEKEYLVNTLSPLSDDAILMLRRGVVMLGKKTYPAKVKKLSPRQYSITIHEGINRQIRRMIESVGNEVVDLKRIRIGKLMLGELPLGKWIRVSPAEII